VVNEGELIKDGQKEKWSDLSKASEGIRQRR
jgi:hypothetical protein